MNQIISTLLIEDNRSLAETIIAYLALESIDCDFAATGSQGLEFALTLPYDVILLDINLPSLSGIEVCEQLRAQGADVSVLMLTSGGTIEDKLAGFDAGTDDYLVKPFEMSELIARVKTLAKRRSGESKSLEIGPVSLNLSLKSASRDGHAINLTPTCWKILELLMRESPNVVSRQKIEASIWGDDFLPETNALKVHLYNLRQKVDKPFGSNLIHTITPYGFAFRNDE